MVLDGLGARARDRLREVRADRAFARRDKPPGEPDETAPRHVVLVVVDALRADAVDPERTPFLASLDPLSAIAPSTWTFPSVTSLASGLYPHRHGAMRSRDGFANSVADVTPLPEPAGDEVPLLGERLAGAGYETFGAFGMIVPFLALRGRFGTHALMQDADAERVLAAHEAWISEHRRARTFSYLHLADAHEPVDPPEAYWRSHDVDPAIPGVRGWRFEDVVHDTPTVTRYRRHRRRLYDAAVEYVDHRLGAYHARLQHLVDGDVLLAVTGDHGEAFWERSRLLARTFADPRPAYGVGHGGAPIEAVTRVPLALAGRGADRVDPPGLDEAPASLVDVAPTILNAAGLGVPADADGRALQAGSAGARRPLVEGARYGHEKKAVYGDDWKLVVSRGDEASIAVPLDADGDAGEPIVCPPEVHRRLTDVLPAWPDGGSDPRTPASVQRRLEQLGYM